MKLTPYPEYKDSGVPWLGQVPRHWNNVRMKHIFKERNVRGYPDEPLLAATQTKGVVRKEEYENRTVVAMKDLHNLQLVRIGDFVISLRSFQGGIEYARHQGIISPAYTIIYAVGSAIHGYFAALFKSRAFIDALTLYVTGIRQGQNIDYVKLSRSPLPIPPIAEQNAISAFARDLDRRCNRFIRNRRQLIEVLNEQKQAIINRAVTRGLNPDVRMKPSGIEWLGDIPEHWKILRSKYLFREVESRSLTGEETHLSMSQLHGLIRSSEIEERRMMSEVYIGGKLCEINDLVLNRLKAHLGVFALAPEPGLVSPDYTVLRAARKLCPVYYEYFYRTPLCRVELRKRAKGIVQGFWRLYTDDFYCIPVPVPPIHEQEMIVENLSKSLLQINNSINKAHHEIELIREYRTRLISDVVTGKVDVRGIEAQELIEQEPLPLDEDTAEPDDLIEDEGGLGDEA